MSDFTKNMVEQELREFWEWCGFKVIPWRDTFSGWKYPNGENRVKLPQVSLHSLFKYAVPKCDSMKLFKAAHHIDYGSAARIEPEGQTVMRFNPDPAIALFNAIQQARKEVQ